jgi:hypothetical protein
MASGNDPQAFTKLMPGFDFMRQFAQTVSGPSATSRLTEWVAPTVSIEELDKRITDLKAVQLWLEQNVHVLRATVQALEVQKMTLAALQGMNLSLPDIAKAFAVPAQATGQVSSDPASGTASGGLGSDTSKPAPSTAQQASAGPHSSDPTPMVDPLQWWGALTQQFQSIAANAVREAERTASARPFDRVAAAKQTRSPSAKPAAEPTNKRTAQKKPAQPAQRRGVA